MSKLSWQIMALAFPEAPFAQNRGPDAVIDGHMVEFKTTTPEGREQYYAYRHMAPLEVDYSYHEEYFREKHFPDSPPTAIDEANYNIITDSIKKNLAAKIRSEHGLRILDTLFPKRRSTIFPWLYGGDHYLTDTGLKELVADEMNTPRYAELKKLKIVGRRGRRTQGGWRGLTSKWY